MKKNFWQTKEGTALIKLSVWIIFFVILFVVFSFQNGNDTKKEESTVKESVKSFKSLEDMENYLLEKGMNYKYTINDGNSTIIYTGLKCNGIDTWYKETENGITKYTKENGVVYKVVLDVKEESTEEVKNLSLLFDNLKEYSYIENKDELERTIKYNLGTYEVTIKTNLENITEIIVIENNTQYNMQFTNIGICE